MRSIDEEGEKLLLGHGERSRTILKLLRNTRDFKQVFLATIVATETKAVGSNPNNQSIKKEHLKFKLVFNASDNFSKTKNLNTRFTCRGSRLGWIVGFEVRAYAPLIASQYA